MGIKFRPGLESVGIDGGMVEKLLEAQKIPVESAKKRRDKVEAEKLEVEKFASFLSDLDQSLNSLKTRYDFYKLKLDSSHPDIVDGTVASGALLGNWELEVRAMARSEKELAYGFPDKDTTPVGFGYMLIDRENADPIEVVVEPGTTLSGLAIQINEQDSGVKAMVINTKYKPDPFRLLVISEKSGKEEKLIIDEDTTFLEFKEQVTGRNLDVVFEDVPVTDEDNMLDELLDDVTLNIRRSEPGTRVQVSVVHDIEATFENIKSFVDSYNEVSGFVADQYVENPETGKLGLLANDSAVKMAMRQLQTSIVGLPRGGESFNSLAEIGITTDPKTGLLNMDEAKVKKSLTDDYDSVARLFIRSSNNVGVAEVMSQKLKNFRDPVTGLIKTRIKGLETMIGNQDQEIERRERQLESSQATLKRRFDSLEGTLAELKSQGDFLKARFQQKKS